MPEGLISLIVALLDCFVLGSGVAPVAVHDKGDVGRYWPGSEDIKDEITEMD